VWFLPAVEFAHKMNAFIRFDRLLWKAERNAAGVVAFCILFLFIPFDLPIGCFAVLFIDSAGCLECRLQGESQ
jgi:hypothetical protein